MENAGAESKNSTDNESDQIDLNCRIDRVLSKYISVWLWSILFGVNSGLTFSYLSSTFRDWGSLSILLVAILAIAVIFSIQAWRYLLSYLTRYLLPKFFSPRRMRLTEDSEQFEERAAYDLRRAALAMFVVASFRAVAEITDLLFAATSGFRGVGGF
jgi:hypothetical protein